MSNENHTDETVEVPEGASEEFAAQAHKKGLSPAVKFGGLVAFAGVALIGAVVMGKNAIEEQPSVVAKRGQALDATPGGAVQQNSQRYQQILEEANAEQAEQASRRGETFIPTPEDVLRPIEDLEGDNRNVIAEPVAPPPPPPAPAKEPDPAPISIPAPPPPPPPAPAQKAPPAPTSEHAQQENPYKEAMLGQMGAIAQGQAVRSMVKKDVKADQGDENQGAYTEEMRVEQNLSTGTSGVDDPAEILIPAGTVVYAETLTKANSDTRTPVLAEVTTGDFKGSKLIGSFEVDQASNRLVVSFNKMSLADGTPLDIEAYAVDGYTAETAVASDVNRRYMSRYGPLLAASFITSYAAAKAEPEQTIVTVGDEAAIVAQPRDSEQALYAGLAAASDAIGQDLVESAPKGPKIILRDGYPIGVMFLNEVVGER